MDQCELSCVMVSFFFYFIPCNCRRRNDYVKSIPTNLGSLCRMFPLATPWTFVAFRKLRDTFSTGATSWIILKCSLLTRGVGTMQIFREKPFPCRTQRHPGTLASVVPTSVCCSSQILWLIRIRFGPILTRVILSWWSSTATSVMAYCEIYVVGTVWPTTRRRAYWRGGW
jgi:hypothetical protein